nr:uncharacterized protein CTRU02_00180 [Colletotrichum truncatum]KAF6801431.1 hypothetical protein CTRU02_00180 [Colletotrichum truncatum]
MNEAYQQQHGTQGRQMSKVEPAPPDERVKNKGYVAGEHRAADPKKFNKRRWWDVVGVGVGVGAGVGAGVGGGYGTQGSLPAFLQLPSVALPRASFSRRFLRAEAEWQRLK